MEIAFPYVLVLGALVLSALIIYAAKRRKPDIFKKGIRVSNTEELLNTAYFKKLYKEYRILSILGCLFILLGLAASFVLTARIVRSRVIDPTVHNRDIFLCLDISDSMDELNMELVDELENMVKELEGERFGISIFNARSVLLVPLTTDYDYVISTLETLKKSFRQNLDMSSPFYDFQNFDYSLYYYKYEGTLCDEGSSYIGDGLCSCLYNFPNLGEEKRSRIIIFATDNMLNGKPLVSVEEATDLCKKNGVRVYAIAPSNVVDEAAFKKDIEKTGGEYYNAEDVSFVKHIVSEIRKTETSSLSEIKTLYTDYPEYMFFLVLICVVAYFAVCKRLRV